MQQQLLGVSSYTKTKAKEEHLLIHRKQKSDTHKEKKTLAFYAIYCFFSPFILSFSLNCTNRKRLKQYTLTHYFVYDNGRTKNKSRSRRKQTAERLNFRFFYFLLFFTVVGSLLVRTVKGRSVKTFFLLHIIFFFLIFVLVFIYLNAQRNYRKGAVAFHNRSR